MRHLGKVLKARLNLGSVCCPLSYTTFAESQMLSHSLMPEEEQLESEPHSSKTCESYWERGLRTAGGKKAFCLNPGSSNGF